MNLVQKYYHWLHGQWPAGKVEQLPDVDERGRTNLPGVYVVGDLNGVPLLKFSAQTGQDAVKEIILNKKNSVEKDSSEELDLAIIGSGVSGVSAAIAAKEAGLNFKIFESNETFSTIVNFPKGKPIFTYPTDMKPEGPFDFDQGCDTKENLLSHLQKQFKQAKIKVDKVYIDEIEKRGNYYKLKSKEQEFQSKNVIIAIGRSGNYRKMNVPGEEMDKVYNRLFDPAEFKEKKVTVVGGGDSAVEAAISLYQAGAEVTLSYRNKDLTRPKPENTEKIYSLASGQEGKNSENKKGIDLKLGSKIKKITEAEVEIESAEGENLKIKNDVVFALIGREAPLQFFRKSGIRLLGELSTKSKALMLLFISFCVWIYHWKGYYFNHLDPAQWVNALKSSQGFSLLTSALNAPANLLGTIAISLESRSFYYTLLYCSCIVFFGIRRMIDKKTPYIKLQTWTLISIQCLPLFILPEIIFPWMGHNGFFDHGVLNWVANELFPIANYGHGREYWRAYGFVLAWPLMAWNVFTSQPMMLWLIIAFLQTFVLIPLIIYKWGKGAYCGWICSCGALAETMGDRHRQKMPHGPFWNKVNMIGQVLLVFAIFILLLRIITWVSPQQMLQSLYIGFTSKFYVVNYKWLVDLFFGGIIGVGFYFWYSGRIWCRFACPLAALMHIYSRFSTFRIFAEKKKCISCNVCTKNCHMGIDVMNFANKGLAMKDPECVRCSACVQTCPTGVLSFGQQLSNGEVKKAWLPASMEK